MTIKEKKLLDKGKIEIDLSGPQGNAYVLLGMAKQYGQDLSLDYKAIVEEMTTGDYENLIEVFDKYFGDYVDLYR